MIGLACCKNILISSEFYTELNCSLCCGLRCSVNCVSSPGMLPVFVFLFFAKGKMNGL